MDDDFPTYHIVSDMEMARFITDRIERATNERERGTYLSFALIYLQDLKFLDPNAVKLLTDTVASFGVKPT